MDDPEGTGDHENYKYFISSNVLFLIDILSDDKIECLQIRIKYEGKMNDADANKRMKLYHRGDDKVFQYNPSLKYGFHCFNDKQVDKKCKNLEYRTFVSCQENNDHC